MSYGSQKAHAERMAAQELVKTYGAPGAFEGVMGEPHYNPTYGHHYDVYGLAKGINGKLAPPVKYHVPFGG